MALYDNGKHKFNKEFISSFKSPGIRAYLKYVRQNDFYDYRSSVCTLEHFLYNNEPRDIYKEAYYFVLGYSRPGKDPIGKNVSAIIATRSLMIRLKEIDKEMHQENNWGMESWEKKWAYIPI